METSDLFAMLDSTWPPSGDGVIALVEECHRAGWTDGLPVVPPTRERVDLMLGGWQDRRDDAIAVVPPGMGEATLEAIASNCVLAGCLPEHFPVVVAAIRALARPRFALDAVITGLNSASPVVVVDGPVVGELGFNSGSGALGGGTRANAAVGRAVQLCIRNLGRAYPGGVDAATHAHPGKYSYLVAASPISPWSSLRERFGYPEDESIVVVYAAEAPLCVTDLGHDAGAILRTIARSVAIPGSYNAFLRQDLWLVVSPEHAQRLASSGIGPEEIAQFVFQEARIPAGRLRGHGLYGFIDDSLPPTWLEGVGDDEGVSVVDRPDRVRVVVSGGMYGGYTSVLLGQGVSIAEPIEFR